MIDDITKKIKVKNLDIFVDIELEPFTYNVGFVVNISNEITLYKNSLSI